MGSRSKKNPYWFQGELCIRAKGPKYEFPLPPQLLVTAPPAKERYRKLRKRWRKKV